MNAALARTIREQLLCLDGVKKQGPVRRGSVIFSADSPSDCVYFVDTGYVKIVQKGVDGKEVLITVIGPGQIFGEQALVVSGKRGCGAEVLQDGVVYEVPKQAFLDFCGGYAECWRCLSELVLARNRDAEQKIGMLCLNDVESRILHYLGSLSAVFGVQPTDGQEYSLPLSQSELASLIGATRETTSTTLNALARKGVVKLGRRMLTVYSQERLRTAMLERRGAAG